MYYIFDKFSSYLSGNTYCEILLTANSERSNFSSDALIYTLVISNFTI